MNRAVKRRPIAYTQIFRQQMQPPYYVLPIVDGGDDHLREHLGLRVISLSLPTSYLILTSALPCFVFLIAIGKLCVHRIYLALPL